MGLINYTLENKILLKLRYKNRNYSKWSTKKERLKKKSECGTTWRALILCSLESLKRSERGIKRKKYLKGEKGLHFFQMWYHCKPTDSRSLMNPKGKKYKEK